MKKIFLQIVVFVFLMAGICSCEKVIQVDLNSAAPQIVITGEVTNEPGPYTVKISKTVNFSSSNTFPAISGAKVKISDKNGLIDTLSEVLPGIYTTHYITGTPGNTYTLSVLAEGKEFTAASTMPQAVPFDSVTIQKIRFFNNEQISAVVNFKDPAGLGNYYQFTQFLNGTELPSAFVLEDRLYDGKYISQNLFGDTTNFKTGDNLAVKMYCIDANIYSYFRTYREVTSNDNRSASPANPNTNISNGALGYFSAHTTETKKIKVP